MNYYRAKLNLLASVSPKLAAASAFRLYCTPQRRARRKDAAVFEKGLLFKYQVQGATVYGHRWNEEGTKKVLIMHGFESSSRNFERYITLLVEKGYQVVAVDAPAHGMSSGRQITLPLYLATITGVNDLYGPFNGYIAHSFGGLTLSHFLESHAHTPETKAVLIAPATETVSTIDSFFRFLRLGSKVRREFDKLIQKIGGGHLPSHFSVRRALNHVTAQVLWLHDEDDHLTPFSDAVKVLNDGHPNVVFRATKGLGHRRIYRDNEVVKEVLDFFN